MYLAIDVGGSKTLLAVFSQAGKLEKDFRFVTPSAYSEWLKTLAEAIKEQFLTYHLLAVCCAIPGVIDRQKGVGEHFGNLSWHDIPIHKDLQRLVPHAQIFIENDANLAGLSEALLVQDQYKKVLYLTISTGVGDGIIINGEIDPQLQDSEPGQMVLEFGDKLHKWEAIASGRALKNRYGKLASQITDPKIWAEFAKAVALGLNELIDTLTPEVVIIGGGVGAHFEKFAQPLQVELEKLSSPLVPIPPLLKAQRPEEAVIYGCYDFIKQHV